jgi:hypothetical protein
VVLVRGNYWITLIVFTPTSPFLSFLPVGGIIAIIVSFLLWFLLHEQHEPFAGSPWSHTDLIRLREGGIGAQVMKDAFVLHLHLSFYYWWGLISFSSKLIPLKLLRHHVCNWVINFWNSYGQLTYRVQLSTLMQFKLQWNKLMWFDVWLKNIRPTFVSWIQLQVWVSALKTQPLYVLYCFMEKFLNDTIFQTKQ